MVRVRSHAVAFRVWVSWRGQGGTVPAKLAKTFAAQPRGMTRYNPLPWTFRRLSIRPDRKHRARYPAHAE